MEARSKSNREEALQKQQRIVRHTVTAAMSNAIPDTTNFGVIFSLHLSRNLLDILFNTFTRFIVFPLAGLFSLVKAGLSWYLYTKDRNNEGKLKKLNLIQAIWDSIQSLGIMGAVITGISTYILGVAAMSIMGISATFSGLLAGGTFYQAALTVYFSYQAYQAHKAWKHESPESDKNHSQYKLFTQHRDMAIQNGIITGIVAALCVGVTVAMVAGFPMIGGIIGVAACATGVAYTAYSLYNYLKSPAAIPADKAPLLPRIILDDEVKHQTTNCQGARIMKSLGANANTAALRQTDKINSHTIIPILKTVNPKPNRDESMEISRTASATSRRPH